jgi:acyl carrier protein
MVSNNASSLKVRFSTSLDAVKIVIFPEKHFGFEVKNINEGKQAFQSINTPANCVEERMPHE